MVEKDVTQKRKTPTAIKVLLILILLLLTAAIIVVAIGYDTYRDISQDPSTAFGSLLDFLEQNPHEIINEEGEVLASKKGVVNVAFLGLDTNDEREEQSMGARNDLTMVASINLDNGNTEVISIPRDTFTEIYTFDQSTGEVESEFKSKLTNAYPNGGGREGYGAEGAMMAAANLLSCDGEYQIPLDLYFSIDMDGIFAICDALGGVEVTLEYDMYYIPETWSDKDDDDLLGYAGETIVLDGEAANSFVRRRKDLPGGDIARARNQQIFMMGMLDRIKELGAVESAARLYDEFLEFADTNISLNQALAFASVVDMIEFDDIVFRTIEGSNDYLEGIGSVIIPDEEQIEQTVEEMFYVTGAE